jgi:NADH:ubiquinone oxidoreductase subunit 11 or 4L (chain K)
MSIEIMFNSAGLVFIIAGTRWKQPDGQVMFIFILAVTAVEVAIGLALLLQVYHHYKTLDADAVNKLKDNN